MGRYQNDHHTDFLPSKSNVSSRSAGFPHTKGVDDQTKVATERFENCLKSDVVMLRARMDTQYTCKSNNGWLTKALLRPFYCRREVITAEQFKQICFSFKIAFDFIKQAWKTTCFDVTQKYIFNAISIFEKFQQIFYTAVNTTFREFTPPLSSTLHDHVFCFINSQFLNSLGRSI